jgi:hypothetical protein
MKHIKQTTLILILNLIFIHYSMGQSSEENRKKDIVLLGAYQMHQADWSPLREQYKVFNASVRDFSSQQLSWILDHSVFPYQPEWCIIHTGLEDLLIGVEVDRVILNVAGLFSTLRESGINVILMGALPNYTLREVQPGQIDTLNDRLKKLAENNGVPFIDTHSFDRGNFFQNNILLNESGCEKWNNIILSEMGIKEQKKGNVSVKDPSSGFVYSAISKERIDRILSESPDEVKLCFLGNSITEGGKDWNQKLNGKYIRNCGQGGYTTRQMSWLMEPTVLSVSPTHCFIMGGINDISLGIYIHFLLYLFPLCTLYILIIDSQYRSDPSLKECPFPSISKR